MIEVSSLKNYPFFQGFSDEQLGKVAAMAKEETHAAGTQMYQKGDEAKNLYLVTEGKIVLFMENYMGPHKPPMQVTVDMITKGEAMGWSAVMEPYIYTLGALCIDDSSLIVFDAALVRKAIAEDCALGLLIMQSVAKLIAQRLTHTRIILVGERGLSVLTEY